ncbi:MAG: tRNA (adenosine(37)-N6)-dimethylallyltransferase MiaA, partial [Treponema sp.]|nr:tRNA (adenosine(37)-N6)-dimethylallyltransferase MiaA [Treponema sp.]
MDFNDSNCVVILGSTAVGKTSVGVKVANELNGEIISADSRQTYKYLDIGSGKDLNEYEISGNKIKYHLIDIVELPEEYNVYKYQKDFYKAFDSILLNNKFPVIVGGTGMYLDC